MFRRADRDDRFGHAQDHVRGHPGLLFLQPAGEALAAHKGDVLAGYDSHLEGAPEDHHGLDEGDACLLVDVLL
jgi:hypothetical protein